MTAAVPLRPLSPFRECTLRAIVLTPTRPIANWLVQLDRAVQQNQGPLAGRAVLLDVSALRPKQAELKALLERLYKRTIRVMAVEGADPAGLGPGMPPLVDASSQTGVDEGLSTSDAPAKAPVHAAAARVVDGAVRSGQSIVFPEGDLTIIGSVSSGAEVVAGGSIHIYGALRGRAVAGSTGNKQARIFCRELEAELLAIDGHYKTAGDMPPDALGRATQAWLEGSAIVIAHQGGNIEGGGRGCRKFWS
jgi:septum site-determining protein MinC